MTRSAMEAYLTIKNDVGTVVCNINCALGRGIGLGNVGVLQLALESTRHGDEVSAYEMVQLRMNSGRGTPRCSVKTALYMIRAFNELAEVIGDRAIELARADEETARLDALQEAAKFIGKVAKDESA